MKPEAYTFFVASNRKGSFRKITLPGYVLHLLAILAVVGGATVLAAAGSLESNTVFCLRDFRL